MKVLVVDDDVVSRMVLMHLIDACGEFEILEAEDGADAWEQLEQGLRPAICFCDLRMPRLSGMDLLQRVKAHGNLGTMPFVLVSSATDRDTVEQASGLGAAGYIVKPFQGEQVREHMAIFAPAPVALPASAAAEPGLAEDPHTTMARLGIGADRLMVYLGGLQAQLSSGAAEIGVMLERAEQSAARLRLARLQAGCATLGLLAAGAALKTFSAGELDAAAVQAALADAVHAAMNQSEAVKRLHAPA